MFLRKNQESLWNVLSFFDNLSLDVLINQVLIKKKKRVHMLLFSHIKQFQVNANYVCLWLVFFKLPFLATVLGWGTVKGCQSYISRHWWLMVGEGFNIQGVQQNTPHFCFCNFSASWWSRNRILGIFELPRFCRFENCPCFYS